MEMTYTMYLQRRRGHCQDCYWGKYRNIYYDNCDHRQSRRWLLHSNCVSRKMMDGCLRNQLWPTSRISSNECLTFSLVSLWVLRIVCPWKFSLHSDNPEVAVNCIDVFICQPEPVIKLLFQISLLQGDELRMQWQFILLIVFKLYF